MRSDTLASGYYLSGREDRQVAHLDLDTFFVSVERLQHRELTGKPVIIGGISDRGVVASCSYETRQYGVHSAMPMKLALTLCPDAIVIRGDMEAYSKYSHMVTDIIAERAPVYEKASIDEHYLDLTGMDRFFGTLRWLHELRDVIIRESGLPISFGLSVNKTLSKMATGEAKPNGALYVSAAEVKSFLAPLSIRKIPMIGEKTYHLLRSMGVTTIEVLSRIPPDMLERILGKNGMVIWKKANGIDNTPIVNEQKQQSISTEHTFDQDTTDLAALNQLLVSMVEKIAFTLRKRQKLTSCVTVKIRYANFDTHTLQKRIGYTSFDHVLIAVAQALFHRLYQRRMRIRLIGVRFSHMVQGVPQLNLFEDTPEIINLYLAMDRLRKRFGPAAIQRAVGIRTPEEREVYLEKKEQQRAQELEHLSGWFTGRRNRYGR